MAGIDYTIPGQFKGIQLESPMNAMAQAMQLRNLQETSEINALRAREASQMNALKAQEYQRGVENRNKLARIHADPKVKIGSPEYLERVYTEVPDLYNDIATKIANRESVLSQIETREAAAQKSKFDLDLAKRKEERDALDLRLKQFNEAFPAYSLQSEQDVEDRIVAMANDEILGPLSTRFGPLGDTIARNKAEFKRDSLGYKRRMAGVSADKILAAAEEKEQAEFSQDQLNRVINKQPLITIDQWRESRRQPQAAPALAAATAPASVDVAMPTEAAVTTEGGDKKLAEVPVVADVSGVDFLDPTAQALYTLASNPKNKDQAPALRDMADKIQAEHAKRLEEKRAEERKSTTLSGDFINVTVAEDKIAELEKDPTPLNLKKIANLRAQIKAANEGKGTKVQVGVKLPPQEKAFEEKLGEGQAKLVLENKAKAEDARDMLDTVSIGRNILKSGAITGAGADFFVGLNQALKTAGVDFGYADASANSQAYTANMAQNVGKLIKLFGAGTGLSNADRDYAEKMAAGKISLDRKALEKILDIQERAARNVIKRHNQNVKDIKTNVPLTVDIDETSAEAPIPKKNSKGWVLKKDKNGNRAYVSPDGKQFEEVK